MKITMNRRKISLPRASLSHRASTQFTNEQYFINFDPEYKVDF